MKIGVILPTFRESAQPALERARQVSVAGLDGVFAYDHLWPMGTPERPALAPYPVLARVALENPHLFLGPLVARIGHGGVHHIADQLLTLASLAPGRVIAALGLSDRLSLDEMAAYGLAQRTWDERSDDLRALRSLLADLPVWVGGSGPSTRRLARELEVEVNLWQASIETLAEYASEGPVSWAGTAPEDSAAWLDQLSSVGVTWAIFSPQSEVAPLSEWRRHHPLTKLP